MRIAIIILIILTIGFYFFNNFNKEANNSPILEPVFNSDRAFIDVEYQISLGPRTVGSSAHLKTIEYIQNELTKHKWDVKIEDNNSQSDLEIKNIVGERGKDEPWILLGAHYDSRLYADKDPDIIKRTEPVPGANDGASGVAVLLELGRILPEELKTKIWLCFFDAEDNGQIGNYDWIMGSQAFVANLVEYPDAVIILDMIGDKDLTIYREKNSSQFLTSEIWDTAANLGIKQFVNTEKYSILDDHTPFLEVGIPAVDIIDFDYPYWHTSMDTLDKISKDSLSVVGATLLTWILNQNQ